LEGVKKKLQKLALVISERRLTVKRREVEI